MNQKLLTNVPKVLINVPKVLINVPKLLTNVPKQLTNVPKTADKCTSADKCTKTIDKCTKTIDRSTKTVAKCTKTVDKCDIPTEWLFRTRCTTLTRPHRSCTTGPWYSSGCAGSVMPRSRLGVLHYLVYVLCTFYFMFTKDKNLMDMEES